MRQFQYAIFQNKIHLSSLALYALLILNFLRALYIIFI